jgi:hypothetical protein
MELILHGALYFKTFENFILNFQKIQEKIVNVANYIHYESVDFQCKIPYSLGLAKKTNQTIFRRLKFNSVYDLRPMDLSILLSQIYNVFCIDNLHVGRIKH